MKYLELWFVKSLPWLVIEIHGSKISFESKFCVKKMSRASKALTTPSYPFLSISFPLWLCISFLILFGAFNSKVGVKLEFENCTEKFEVN
jgi:hypothetical protein